MSDEPEINEHNEESPVEELQDAPQTGIETPGIQKPESEVLNEINMNTE